MKKRYNSGSQAPKGVVRDTMGLIHLHQFYQYNFIGSSEKAPHLQHGNKDIIRLNVFLNSIPL